MTNEITATDQFVRRELEKMHSQFQLEYTEQTSNIPEVKKALKGASKQGGKGIGKPEFVFLSNDLLVIIENKLLSEHLISLDPDGTLNMAHIAKYAVNGAVHYAKHVVQKAPSFREVIAVGVTGNEESHSIQPYFVSLDDDNVNIQPLPKLKSLQELNPSNIEEWYSINVLGNYCKEQQKVIELQKVASELHDLHST